MISTVSYPKRLIEVDLPIKRISAHARREKSIRHGHISTLHIWWARRPLAACRAVICASLWPDPADEHCPEAFRKVAREQMGKWAKDRLGLLSQESYSRFMAFQKDPKKLSDNTALRNGLLDFIADFANWDNSTVKEYLETSRALTQAAHEALGGVPGTRPLVVDPFAGGGAIPLEALRVGADVFASDLNPIPVLLNKVVLEYIPKYGSRLADEVRKWGAWIKGKAEKELAEFYPKDINGATPIAYLWARTIKCEGPGCGAEVPLIRSFWLAKKANRSVALQLLPRPKAKRVEFQIIVKQRGGWMSQDDLKEKISDPKLDGTVARGSATCPCCGYTTPVGHVREQFKTRRGGANDAKLMCVVTTQTGEQGRGYRVPTKADLEATHKASAMLEKKSKDHKGALSLVPDEKLDVRGIRHTWAMIYGVTNWGDCFTPRQSLALASLFGFADEYARTMRNKGDDGLSDATQTCIALIIDKLAQYNSSMCRWKASGENLVDTFGRQALPMVWDFAEANPFAGASGDFTSLLEWHVDALTTNSSAVPTHGGSVGHASATAHPYPDDSANAFVTDPPYYDAVPYAFLSDFFYVWLRRALIQVHGTFATQLLVPKDQEIVVDRAHELSDSTHNIAFYEKALTKAFAEGRRVLRPDGVGTIVFASKTTASWEAILKAVVDAGWIITGSWPIDTEMETRVAAQGQARLASSVHLVCRPRENSDGSVRADDTGDWREVLTELPKRIHDWMPRLAEEGVVGADAIFACLGPALEIFSRYSRVEKASGKIVTLKEYLEQVWAAISKEALKMIFEDADASGFEEDARLTAMWLWTLATGDQTSEEDNDQKSEKDPDNEESSKAKTITKGGFALEYDAARKIAQGLGAHLENLEYLVKIQGETAILLPVAARTRYLFGKDSAEAPKGRAKKKDSQLTLNFEGELKKIETESEDWTGELKSKAGQTILDQLHQSMILFAAGRGEALKRFLVEDGIGRNPMFWKLAQALSALYPSATDEKRWVDGVLARKKGLGF